MSKKSRKAKAAKTGNAAKKAQNSQLKGAYPISELSQLKDLLTKVNPERLAIAVDTDIDPTNYQIYFFEATRPYNFGVNRQDIPRILDSLSKGTVVAFEEADTAYVLAGLCQHLELEPHMLSGSLVSELSGIAGDTPTEKVKAIYKADKKLSQDPEGHKKLSPIVLEDVQVQSLLNDQLAIAKADVEDCEQQVAAALKNLGCDVDTANLVEFARKVILSIPQVHNYIIAQLQTAAYAVKAQQAKGVTPQPTLDYTSQFVKAEDNFLNLYMKDFINMSMPTKLLPLLFNFTNYRRACFWAQAIEIIVSKAAK